MIAGLILAAGAGTRFGPSSEGSKLLADLDGRPVLEHAIAAVTAVPELARVVVVLGHGAEAVLARVSFGRAAPVVCADWESGQAASLRCGLEALSGADRVIVTLGDSPLLTPAVVGRFVDAAPGTRAVYAGRPGHPVLLGAHHMSALLSLTGDRGARDLLRGGPTIECSELCSGRDVDTPEDLKAIRDETGSAAPVPAAAAAPDPDLPRAEARWPAAAMPWGSSDDTTASPHWRSLDEPPTSQEPAEGTPLAPATPRRDSAPELEVREPSQPEEPVVEVPFEPVTGESDGAVGPHNGHEPFDLGQPAEAPSPLSTFKPPPSFEGPRSPEPASPSDPAAPAPPPPPQYSQPPSAAARIPDRTESFSLRVLWGQLRNAPAPAAFVAGIIFAWSFSRCGARLTTSRQPGPAGGRRGDLWLRTRDKSTR